MQIFVSFFFIFFKDFILFLFLFFYLFMRDTERERKAETQAEGEAGPVQGARCGTPSRVSRITPRPAGGTEPLRHQGCPVSFFFSLTYLVNYFSKLLRLVSLFIYLFIIYLLFIYYLFIHERHRERDRDTGRGRSRLHAGSPMWDSIPGLQGHALSQIQMLNH